MHVEDSEGDTKYLLHIEISATGISRKYYSSPYCSLQILFIVATLFTESNSTM